MVQESAAVLTIVLTIDFNCLVLQTIAFKFSVLVRLRSQPGIAILFFNIRDRNII